VSLITMSEIVFSCSAALLLCSCIVQMQ